VSLVSVQITITFLTDVILKQFVNFPYIRPFIMIDSKYRPVWTTMISCQHAKYLMFNVTFTSIQ